MKKMKYILGKISDWMIKNRRRLLWFGLWILSLVSITCYGGSVSYGFFYAVTILPILLLAYICVVFYFFKTYQELETKEVVCGERTPYLFVLKNEGFFPFAGIKVRLYSLFSTVENMKDDTEYELLYGEFYTFKTNLVCNYCGEYEVGIKEAEITDFLRIFTLRYRVKSYLTVTVKPRICELTRLGALEEMMGYLEKESFRDESQPDVLVREYVPGDEMRRISWRMTAKENKLMVRKQTGQEKQGVVVFADTGRYTEDKREYLPVQSKIQETLVSLGFYMVKENMPFTAYLETNSPRSCYVGDVSGFEEYYDRTFKMSFRSDDRPWFLMENLLKSGVLQETKLIFGVLHEINEDVMQMTISLSEAGVLVILYVVTQEDIQGYIKQNNERRRIVAILPEAELDGRL